MRAVINKDLVATRKQLADKEFRLGRIILQRCVNSMTFFLLSSLHPHPSCTFSSAALGTR